MQIAAAREQSHLEALKLLKQGAYDQAIAAIRATLEKHGCHVGLLADLAGAIYLKGEIGEFALAVERLESEFEKCRELLSARSRILTHITLAKYFEELGRIAEAFDRIESALAEIPPGTPLALRTRCQKLRLLASFGKEDEVAALYRACLTVSDQTPDLKIECFHALLIAESRVLGFESAWPRLVALEQAGGLDAADLRLCLVDLLEAAVEKNQTTARERILNFIEDRQIGGLDAYEKMVVRIAAGRPLQAEELFSLSRAVTPYGLVRSLALSLPANKSDVLTKKFLLLIQSYDHRTQKILQRKWGHLLIAGEGVRAELDSTTRSVRQGQERLSLNSSPLTWILLENLCSGSTEPDDLLEKIAKCGDSIHNVESMRIALLRLNKKLSSFLAVDWVFKFRKTGVVVNDRIQWKRV